MSSGKEAPRPKEDVKVPPAVGVKSKTNLVAALAYILGFVTGAIFASGYFVLTDDPAARGAPAAKAKLEEKIPAELGSLDEEQIKAWFEEISARLPERQRRLEALKDGVRQLQLEYTVLRSRRKLSPDHELCRQMVKEKAALDQSLAFNQEQVDILKDLYDRLQLVLRDIEHRGFLEKTSDMQSFASEVQRALSVKEFAEEEQLIDFSLNPDKLMGYKAD